MSVVRLERDEVTKPEDPSKEIEAHMAYIDRLRGPITFDLIIEMLEKSVFKIDEHTRGLKPRIFFVYLKNHSGFEQKIKQLITKQLSLVEVIEQAKPLIMVYIAQLIPTIFDQAFWKFVEQEYETKIDTYARELPQYLLRVSQIA